ncbi:hypothetical protein [Actinomadura sp. 3N407]|uniref:hypothetical protein n=1 Tax=Actinomadura sp. 3N407 TaxID=3457423 RepID=UPI003FCE888F
MTPPTGATRRTGLGWSLIGIGWALFAAALLVAFTTSSGFPSVTELGRTGRLWALLPMVAVAGVLILVGCRLLTNAPWFSVLLLIPLALVVAPPIALSRFGGASRVPRRADPDRGPFAGDWPTPPGGHAR